jgi:hypothetical protein
VSAVNILSNPTKKYRLFIQITIFNILELYSSSRKDNVYKFEKRGRERIGEKGNGELGNTDDEKPWNNCFFKANQNHFETKKAI